MAFRLFTLVLLFYCFSLSAQDFDSSYEDSYIEKRTVQPKKFFEIGELASNYSLSNMLENKTFEQINKFYKSLPTNNKNSAIDKLVYNVLVSKINLEAKNFSPNQDKQIFEIRISKLFEMGKFEDIDNFYSQMPMNSESETLNKKRIEAYLLRNEFKNACKLHQKLTVKKSYEWGKLEIICNMVNQNFEKARFSLSLLKEFNFPGDTLFIDLAYKIIGDIEISDEEIYNRNLGELKTLTPVLLSSMQIAEISPSFENIKNSPINQLIFILSSPSSSTEVKLYCAERLVRLKRIKPQMLAEVYQLSNFSNEEVENVLELYKTFSPVRSRALIYQAIIIETDPKIKFKLIQLLLNQSKKENLFKPMAILLKNSLDYSNYESSDEIEKALILDILLSNSQYSEAKDYIETNKGLSVIYNKKVFLDLLMIIDDEQVKNGEINQSVTPSILLSNFPKKFIENFLILESFIKDNEYQNQASDTNSFKLDGDIDLLDFIFIMNDRNEKKDFKLFGFLIKIVKGKDIQNLNNLDIFVILKIIQYFAYDDVFKDISKDILFSQI